MINGMLICIGGCLLAPLALLNDDAMMLNR
jgi:hypothetical protein